MNALTLQLRKFILFASLFIGTGFIAGSIVHFGEGITTWDVSVLFLGIILFVTASYIEKCDKKHSGLARFLLFIIQSLLLAIGIGMASGGTQHFVDTPAYSAILIPLGLFVGLLAYLWREQVSFSVQKWIGILCVSFLFAWLLWIALVYANSVLPESIRKGHGSHGHASHSEKQLDALIGETIPDSAYINHSGHLDHADHADHGAMVQNESDFITLMIPHHQEAIDTSNMLLAKGATGELATFLQDVVRVQSEEIEIMKQWHQDWYNTEYINDSRYENMMRSFEDLELEEAIQMYLQDMIVHHKGAVQMAERLPEITTRPELLTFGENIIALQSHEIALMQDWLEKPHNDGHNH